MDTIQCKAVNLYNKADLTLIQSQYSMVIL